MSTFDVERISRQLHAADDGLRAQLVGELSAHQAELVLMDYRDRYPEPDGNAVFWRLSDKVCGRP